MTITAIQVLTAALGGAPRAGQVGVVVARAGAGRAALLTQLAGAALSAGQGVLHLRVGGELGALEALHGALCAEVSSERLVLGVPAASDDVIEAVRSRALAAERHQDLAVRLLVIDGLAWGNPGVDGPRVEALRAVARDLGAGLWLGADTYTGGSAQGGGLGAPLAAVQHHIDCVIALNPWHSAIDLGLLRAPALPSTPPELILGGDDLVLRARADRSPTVRPALPASAHTLLSGGAAGAEVEFGLQAERHGVVERTFTFTGRLAERARGLVVLGDDALALAAPSLARIEDDLGRRFPETPLFRRVLQSIWHQVDTAGEVFAVGAIQADKTVTGGTGWAARLAAKWGKPVHVYDQDHRRWMTWSSSLEDWTLAAAPRVSRARFCGTGTRFLSDDGKAAIAALFDRSFSP
jgi:hypothetical protein